MSESSVPGAVAALVALLREAPAFAGASVVDGPSTVDIDATAVVDVGGGWDDSSPIDGEYREESLGAGRLEETYDIPVGIAAVTGDDDQQAARELVFGFRNALAALLLTPNGRVLRHPSLPATDPGAVRRARIAGRWSLDQWADDAGRNAALVFFVRCTARI